MSEKLCPVNQTISGLREAIEAGRLSNPRSRRIAEEILDLLADVASGRAGGDHLGAIAALADELSYDKASAGAMAASKRSGTRSASTARCSKATSTPTTAPPAPACGWCRPPAR